MMLLEFRSRKVERINLLPSETKKKLFWNIPKKREKKHKAMQAHV